MARMTLKAVDHKGGITRRSIFEVLSTPDTGASPRGSTYFKTTMGCPREFGLSYVAGFRPEVPAEQLTTGWFYHHCLQLYYEAIRDHQQSTPFRPRDPDWLWGGERAGMQAAYAELEILEAEPGYGELAATVRRMLDAYFDTYSRQDKWRIIAVEETLFYHGALAYSARLDLIVEDYDRSGMWIVEHKSARAITADLMDNYQLDLQILGQVWLLQTCVDLSKYPHFQGVKVSITTKAETPKTTRVDVCPSPRHLQAFERSVGQLQALLPVYKQLGWPQFLGHCAGYARGYSRCQFYDVCHGHPKMTVDDWITQEDPPEGFIRNTELGNKKK